MYRARGFNYPQTGSIKVEKLEDVCVSPRPDLSDVQLQMLGLERDERLVAEAILSYGNSTTAWLIIRGKKREIYNTDWLVPVVSENI